MERAWLWAQASGCGPDRASQYLWANVELVAAAEAARLLLAAGIHCWSQAVVDGRLRPRSRLHPQQASTQQMFPTLSKPTRSYHPCMRTDGRVPTDPSFKTQPAASVNVEVPRVTGIPATEIASGHTYATTRLSTTTPIHVAPNAAAMGTAICLAGGQVVRVGPTRTDRLVAGSPRLHRLAHHSEAWAFKT